MKRFLIPFLALCLGVLVLMNYRFHWYDRLFNPKEFYFVTVKGTDFYLRGKPFRFIGANTRLIHGDKERSMVSEALQSAQANAMRVIRQWAIGECENDSTAVHRPIQKYYFQAGPSNWIEESFAHFDLLLAEAAKLDIKVMITLINNWRDFGGMPMYLKWTGLKTDSLIFARHDSFYSDPQIERWIKAFVRKLVTRRNTVTGKLYRDDPTIFSWELVNEARARLDTYPAMIQWTKSMAEYIKELDPNHLVGISMGMVDNRIEREHSKNVFSLEAIDYVDMHMYPAEFWWENFIIDKNTLRQLIDDFTQIALYVVKKPLIIGEVGFRRDSVWLDETRDELFSTLFDYSYHNGVSGVMVWSYSDPNWDDVHEINWREKEHAKVCSVLTVYGEKFFKHEDRMTKNPNIGPEHGDSLRIKIDEQTFAKDPQLSTLNNNVKLKYEIPPRAYAKAKWTNFNYWDKDKGFAEVYGKDHGYFVYSFFVAGVDSISRLKLSVRLSSDFPPIPGADTLGVSDVTISINQTELATITVRPQKYFGTLYEVNIGRDHGRRILTLPAGNNWLKFEVKENAVHRNGLVILGAATSNKFKKDEIPILLEFVL